MKKTLLIVIDQLGIGGTERQLSQLLPHINNNKRNIIVYTLFSRGVLSDQISKDNIRIISPPFYRFLSSLGFLGRGLLMLLSLFKLTFIVFYNKPTLVHYYLPKAYLLGSFCMFLFPKVKFLMSRRSLNDYQKKYPRLAIREQKLHKKMSMIFANSKVVFNQLMNEENVPKSRLKIIYNGVDMNQFKRKDAYLNMRALLDISKNTLLLITVANLFPYKGHADLLRALKIAQHNLPKEWCLLCVGRDEGEKENLQYLTREYGLQNNIRWLGERCDIPALLSVADIALLCSHQEGFSNSVLEAMASRLPLIVTNVGGNSEAVVDGVTGIIVPPRNPELLADALIKLSSSTELQKQMGSAGFQRAQAYFSLDRCVEQYDAIYSELMC